MIQDFKARLLKKELVLWVDHGIISSEQSQKIINFYSDERKSSFSLLSIIATLLISLGIISAFAYNWDDLAKWVKAITGFGLNIFAIILALVFTRIQKSPQQFIVVEIFWFFSFVASFAIISQTYHISSDLNGFMLWVAIINLPLIFILNSNMIAYFIMGILCFVIGGFTGSYYVIALIMSAIWLGFYIWRVMRGENTLVLDVVASLGFLIIFEKTLHDYTQLGITRVILFSVFMMAYLAIGKKFNIKSFEIIGVVSLVVISAFVFSSFISYEHLFKTGTEFYIAGILALISCIALSMFLPYFSFLLLSVGAFFLQWLISHKLGFDIYTPTTIILGGFGMWLGYRKTQKNIVRIYAFLVVGLIVIRFLNSTYPLLTKAILFISLGVIFFVINAILKGKKNA